MRTKLIAAVVTTSITLGIGWYVVAQETFPFGPLPLFAPNSVLTSQQLNAIVERINAMIAFVENDLDDAPQEIVVNCPTDSLAVALHNADDGDTIKISGTCSEPVTIFKDGLTLDGQGTAIIDGGGGFAQQNVLQGVITIAGARNVTIKNLTIQNGPDGVLAGRGATVVLDHVAAQDNADDGIQVEETSTAELINCTALRNGGRGVAVDDSHVTISNSTITGNGTDVSAFFGARLTLHSNTIGTITCEPTVLSRGTTLCPL
jgi:parallel beta-helix repeat protein